MISAGALAFLVETDDDSSAAYSIDSDVSFVKSGGTVTFTIKNDTSDKVYCNWYLYSSSGTTEKNGTFTIDGSSSHEQEVTTPSTAGDYRFVVKFYKNSEKGTENHICDRERHVKVVDPVKITINLENSSSTSYQIKVYLQIKNGNDWTKIDDSEKTVSISAYNSETGTKGTGTYSYEYVVNDLSKTTTFRLHTDDTELAGVISNIDTEFSFYTYQNDYTLITVFMVIVLILVLIVSIWIYRKPIKNFGKPKARR